MLGEVAKNIAKTALNITTAREDGRGRSSKANITTIFESPSFIPGITKGKSGIRLSKKEIAIETAQSRAVRAKDLTLLEF